MADGQGFARRITLDNLEEFAEFLGRTRPFAWQSDQNETEEEHTAGGDIDGSASSGSGDAPRSQKGRDLFPGEAFPVDLPFAPPMPPNRREVGGTSIKKDVESTSDEVLQVLVATLPDSSTRWGQANFTLDLYENYFGAKVGTKRTITLRHVGSDGTLEDVEQAESVESKSRNYRFELGAASGPPPNGRPLAVFMRLANRLFLYRLLEPGSDGYSEAANILARHWPESQDNVSKILQGAEAPKNEVPRVLIDSVELQKLWPNCPLLRVISS